MKRIFYLFILILFLLFSLSILVLSTNGFETNRFNNLISSKITEKNKSVSLKLDKIKFKFDIKNISLFLETQNPKLIYKKLDLPLEKIYVYLDFTSIIKSKPKIKKIKIWSKKIDIDQLKKILVRSKPSNITSIVNNNISKGNLKTNVELFFGNDLVVEDFIARGEVEKMTTSINSNFILKDTNFNFFADKSDILIKSLNGKTDGIQIKNSDLIIERNKNLIIKSNIFTDINFNKKNIINYQQYLKKQKNFNQEINLESKLSHNLNFTFDNTFKLIDYSIKSTGEVTKLNIKLNKMLKSSLLQKDIDIINFKDTDLTIKFSFDKKNSLESKGLYQINNRPYKNFDIKDNFSKDNHNIELNMNLNLPLSFDLINYEKDEKKDAELQLNFKKEKNKINFLDITYAENKNLINLEKLQIKNNLITSLNKLEVKTYNSNEINNDFSINFGKQIIIKGKKFDGTNLNKVLNKKTKSNYFKNISKNIEIDLKSIITPLSKKLSNFKLIGELKKGEFIKISSKGELGNNKFLDIAMKSDKNNKKKFLEVYSDLPGVILSEYEFFKGLSGGVLNFSSVIEKNLSTSKLIIEEFKIINAPAVVKLLSLADFGGLADLAEGEGLSFEKLEIQMSESNGFLKLEELYAVGPSISVLMEGYRDANGLTSLRGTLVPAKNLNKLLAKIPLIGDIIIPKDVGEGLFGVSFKIKGPPGKVKTTINPIKTLTPRFITKALERSKKN